MRVILLVIAMLIPSCAGGCGHRRSSPETVEQQYDIDWRDRNNRGVHQLASRQPIRITTVKLPDECKPNACYCSSVNETISTFDDNSTQPCQQEDVVTDEVKVFLNSVIDDAVSFLQTALMLDRMTSPLRISVNGICGFTSGGQSRGVVVPTGTTYNDADFVVYSTAVPAIGLTQAWAVSCQNDQSGRPNVAIINFAPAAFPLDEIKAHPLMFENAKKTAIHELIHALGYSDDYYGPGKVRSGWFQTVNGIPTVKRVGVDNLPVDVMRTPKVLEMARKHFNCSTLSGVELENQGGKGTSFSHWEKRVLGSETMTGVQTAELSTVSAITLAYFEDTGIYNVNYEVAEDLPWGNNKGCDFISRKCNDTSFSEFCFPRTDNYNELSDGCSETYLGHGVCDIANITKIEYQYRYFEKFPNLGSGAILSDFCPFRVPTMRCTDTHIYEQNCVNFKDESSCRKDPHCSYNNNTKTCTAVQTTIMGQSFGESSRCYISDIVKRGWSVNHNNQARCFITKCASDYQSYNIIVGDNIVLYCNKTTEFAITPQELRDIYDNPIVKCSPVDSICGKRGWETTVIPTSSIIIPKSKTENTPNYRLIIMIAGGCLLVVCVGVCFTNKCCTSTDQTIRQDYRTNPNAFMSSPGPLREEKHHKNNKKNNYQYDQADHYIPLADISTEQPLE